MYRGFLIAIGLAGVVVSGSSVSALAQTEEEVAREIARQISDAISRRVGEAVPVAPEADAAEQERKWTLWGKAVYSQTGDDDQPVGFDSDTFIGILGGDRRVGRFTAGVSGSYAHNEFDSSVAGFSLDANSDSLTVSPYGVVEFNQYFSMDAIVGASFSETDVSSTGTIAGMGLGFSGDSSSRSVFTVLEGIGKLERDKLKLKVKAGHRFNFTTTDVDGGSDTDTRSYTLFAGGEVGYMIGKVTPYVAGQYEFVDPEDDMGEFDNDFLYLTGGADVQFTDRISAGVSVSAEVVNSDTDNFSAKGGFRVKF